MKTKIGAQLAKIDEKVFAEIALVRAGRMAVPLRQRTAATMGSRHKTCPTRPSLTKEPGYFLGCTGDAADQDPHTEPLSPEQMEVLAELAEEYSDAICHVTTRQDIQLHFVHIEDTPSDFFEGWRRWGFTTREACVKFGSAM